MVNGIAQRSIAVTGRYCRCTRSRAGRRDRGAIRRCESLAQRRRAGRRVRVVGNLKDTFCAYLKVSCAGAYVARRGQHDRCGSPQYARAKNRKCSTACVPAVRFAVAMGAAYRRVCGVTALACGALTHTRSVGKKWPMAIQAASCSTSAFDGFLATADVAFVAAGSDRQPQRARTGGALRAFDRRSHTFNSPTTLLRDEGALLQVADADGLARSRRITCRCAAPSRWARPGADGGTQRGALARTELIVSRLPAAV